MINGFFLYILDPRTRKQESRNIRSDRLCTITSIRLSDFTLYLSVSVSSSKIVPRSIAYNDNYYTITNNLITFLF